MRVTISKIKTLDELYVMRDKEIAQKEQALADYYFKMAEYISRVQDVLEHALNEIVTGKFDIDDHADDIYWSWTRNGINLEVSGERPQKPGDLPWKLVRTIAMLERSTKDEISVDENHEIVSLLVPRT